MKKRKFVALLCAISTLLSFSACGGQKKETDKASVNTTTTSADVTQKEVTESKAETEREKETQSASNHSSNNLNDIVIRDIEDTIAQLTVEYETLKSEVDTYTKFLSSTERLNSFYARIYDANYKLCVRICEHSLKYAEDIVNSDMSNDDKYDELDELYDSIYDDGGEEIYDGIYDGILEDMYDDFYDGLLDEAYNNEEYSEYSEWSDVRSDEYKRWSETRSDVYKDWSDTRSDIYEFWTDLRSELWDDDAEKAKKKIEDFREDIAKLKISDAPIEKATPTEELTVSEIEIPVEETTAENLVDGMRPEFKNAMDAYVNFYAEYCDFMKEYNDNPTDLSLLAEYAKILVKAAEMDKAFEEWDNGEMNQAETKYYLDVTNRINQMLLDVAA